MKSNWLSNPFQDKDIEKSILRGRGITDYEKFLYPTIDKLNNPFLLIDGEEAANRIISAINSKEKIFIFGHDDVDGVTSTVILYNYLTQLGSKNHFYYIPNREFERYGVQKSFIDKMLAEMPKLIITVDCGINELKAIDFFNKYNIDTIVLDHHIVYQELPKAVATVDPKRKKSPKGLPRHDRFPFDMLAGVGVVYNVIEIIEQMKKAPVSNLCVALTGLGTIADRVPLIDDNRVFAKFIFENIFDLENLFLSFFLENNKSLSKDKIINLLIKLLTMGRDRNGVHLGVEILLENRLIEVKNKYKILQERLERNNKEAEKVIKFIEAKFLENESEEIFIYLDEKNNIPIKLLGKAASYIADKYKILAMVLATSEEGILSAEARGHEGFDWVDSFNKISEHLINYGGHKRAAGFTCYASEFDKIRNKLFQIAEANPIIHSSGGYKDQKIRIDYQILKENLDIKRLQEIFNLFSPFGEGNKPPVFLANNLSRSELENLNFYNIPELHDNEKANVVFSVNDNEQKRLKMLDYEIE